MRVFQNPNGIPEARIRDRFRALDAAADVAVLKIPSPDAAEISHVVLSSLVLSDQDVINILSTAMTAAEIAAQARTVASSGNAAAIPGWATWTEAQALDWGNTNIATPLTTGRANLPATLTLVTARAAIVAIIDILDKMWVMQWALARLVIAMRDKIWPNL